ncbi:ABC transporter permease [Corynebacterium fournieri]|uniref:ABC transporter permease n=1 Tax=Corynebacterium fournieri TaxID=1852390 RepID=UPI000A2F2F8F|nr:FtsX-like permease family protein [Corynebacterium fournieri]WJY98219.1 ABC transporter permease YtrF precursor [Corynebacterium fournieri]
MANTLTKVSLRNVAAHKLRLALTVLAVVLGTAFLSGALMLTNMLSSTFDSAVDTAFEDVDAVVRPGEGSGSIDMDTFNAVKADADVERVNVFADEPVVVARQDEVAIQTQLGTSRLMPYYGADEAVGRAPVLVDGSAPTAPGTVAVNANGAQHYGIEMGERLIVVDKDGRNEFTVSGLYDDPMAQETSLVLRIGEDGFRDAYTNGKSVPGMTVQGSPEVVERLQANFPGVEVREGAEVASEISAQIRDGLSFVSYFLVAFGLVGLLVGTFLIANTFSMIVAQRTREFALLRALGASRGQITRSVAFESVLVGLAGSALGVVGGAGLVALIRVVMGANGMPLPDAGTGLSAQAVIVPVVVGTLVTVLSALAPARRAGQVRPVEAMRSSEAAAPQPLRLRTVAGLILVAAGVVAAAYAMGWGDGATGRRAGLVGVAALAAITGLFLAGPALSLPVVPPLGRIIGAPFGAVGKLASTNTRRNPRRTATTAFALMLGIALVTVIGMLGASMKQSVDDVATSEVSADFVLSGPQNGVFPLPDDLPERLAEVDGVGETVSFTQAPISVDGQFGYQLGSLGMTDVLQGDPAQLINLHMVEGSSSLDGNTVIAPLHVAEEHGWHVGDTLAVAGPNGQVIDATLSGVFEGSNILQSFVVSDEAAAATGARGAGRTLMIGVNNAGDVDDAQLRANLEEAVRHDIVVQVRSTQDMSGEVSAMIDQMLFILYALLSLAVVIAALGIVNTLTLSVIERRQEIGMLRAVGTQRRQVRTMITLESVQMTVYGAVLGVLLGLGLGWAFLTVLEAKGLTAVIVPWELVGAVLAGSFLLGLLAAVWPASRAAKTPPLDAIAE